MKFTNWNELTGFGSETAEHERADCTVRAIALATDVPYDVAHTYMAKRGRKPRRAARRFIDTVQKDPRFHVFKPEARTVGQFLKQYPKGRYIVHVRQHVLPVIDGVAFDWCKRPRRRVSWAARVVEEVKA